MKEKTRAAILLFIVCAILFLCSMWDHGDQQQKWTDRLRAWIKGLLMGMVKAVGRVIYAMLYYHVFVVIFIATVRFGIESIFLNVLQGGLSGGILLRIVLTKILPILLLSLPIVGVFEFFLKVVFREKEEIDSVFATISWFGNMVLALVGALGLYYAVYPQGIGGINVKQCVCAEATLAEQANGYIWAETFLMLFGIIILDFYRAIMKRD